MNANIATARTFICLDCGNQEGLQILANEHHNTCEIRTAARAEFVKIRMERFGYV